MITNTQFKSSQDDCDRMRGDDILVMSNITKSYHGVLAVKNVNFTLKRGEIHALLGENGAGKSTLSKMLSGVTSPTSGSIRIDNSEFNAKTPAEARSHGIVMVFQETSLVPSMTVAQNLYLGDEKVFNPLRSLYIEAQVFLSSLNFDVDPWASVSTLGAAKKQMVEIARAVKQNARVIIFDEPTATLTPAEKENFFSLVKRLQNSGVSIIFISHALEEALSIANTITILRDGEVVISDRADKFDRGSIVRAMVGRELSDELYGVHGTRDLRKRGAAVLSVENLSMGKTVRNNSFCLYGGQITGMFGLIGSGRTETAKVIAGILKRDYFYGGSVRFMGRLVDYSDPREAIMDGVIYVTEDRKIEGFFDSMSISDNLHIAKLAASKNIEIRLKTHDGKMLYNNWKNKLAIRSLDDTVKVFELSGGNQQKVVIAKSLIQHPHLVIFDEPTRGVDVGAIAEIHKLINDLAESGMAVLVISSYLPEIRNLSDRILVTRAGRVVSEFNPDSSEDDIMFAAVH